VVEKTMAPEYLNSLWNDATNDNIKPIAINNDMIKGPPHWKKTTPARSGLFLIMKD
jgi:hypothetical protein